MDSETLKNISFAIDRMRQIKSMLEHKFNEKYSLTINSSASAFQKYEDSVTFDRNSDFEAYGHGHGVILKIVRDALEAEYEELRRGLADFGVTIEGEK